MEGWSISPCAASMAACSSATSSSYTPVFFQSTTWVCQWYASYRAPNVLAKRDIRVALDGDLVVVVDDDQVAELLVARERGSLAGDALLDVAVAGDHVDEVIERAGACCGIRVEQAALETCCVGETHGGGQPLAQRTGGHLDAGGVAVLRVARGGGAPGAVGLKVGALQPVAAEVELDVLGQRAVAAGEDEPIPADPSVSLGSVRMTFWNSRYAAGARLIAVPGCPLPTFCTASAARSLAVFTAVSSIESHLRADILMTLPPR